MISRPFPQTAARTHKPPRGLELLRPAARSARTETQPPCALYSTLRARRAASQHDREKAPAAAAGAPQIPTRNTNTGAAAPLNRRPLGTRRENMQMQQERCEKLGQAATKQLDREGRAKGRRGASKRKTKCAQGQATGGGIKLQNFDAFEGHGRSIDAS